MAGAADQRLEPGDGRIAGEAAPRGREVGGRGAVERPELQRPLRAKALGPAPRLRDEQLEPAPVGTPRVDEPF